LWQQFVKRTNITTSHNKKVNHGNVFENPPLLNIPKIFSLVQT
jgi:hypothetical protein